MSDQLPAGHQSVFDNVIRFGKEFGAIALILAFYMGQDAGWIPNPTVSELKEINRALQEIKGQGIQHDTTMRELTKAVEEQGDQLAEQRKSWQKRCVMRATTNQEKEACYTEGKDK